MDEVSPHWVTKFFDWRDGLPRPRWWEIEGEVYRRVELCRESEVDLWRDVAVAWLTTLGRELGPSYEVVEGPRTLVLGCQSTTRLGKLRERSDEIVARFRSLLPDLGQHPEAGKHVAVAIEDERTFHRYARRFFPEGLDIEGSSVHFVREGYRHVAIHGLARLDIGSDPAITLALVRACISHLLLPPWLELGIALAAVPAFVPDYVTEHFAPEEHKEFWTEARIEGFWSGQAFEDPAAEYAFDLACIIVQALAEDPTKLQRFVLKVASGEGDAKEIARQTLGVSLDDIVSEIVA